MFSLFVILKDSGLEPIKRLLATAAEREAQLLFLRWELLPSCHGGPSALVPVSGSIPRLSAFVESLWSRQGGREHCRPWVLRVRT